MEPTLPDAAEAGMKALPVGAPESAAYPTVSSLAAAAAASSERDRSDGPSRFEAVAFLYLPFFAGATLAFASTADDPLITLRYAANVVHGYGPVFNRGEAVQGFTSPLHLVVAIAAYALPWGHDLLKLKLASLLFGVLTIREAGLLLFGLPNLSRGVRRVGFAVVGAGWTLAFASTNGLETALEAWLIAWLVRVLVTGGAPSSRIGVACLAAAAVLSRPDALLLVCALAVAGALFDRGGPRRLHLAAGAGALVCAGCVTLGSWLYYHDPLPNTFYAKHLTLHRALHGGWDYLFRALQPGLPSGLVTGSPTLGQGTSEVLLLVQLALLVSGVVYTMTRFRRGLYLVAVVGAQAGFILVSGGDWMKGGRFLAPTFVELASLEVLGLYAVIDLLRREGRLRSLATTTVTFGVLLVATSAFPLATSHDPAWNLAGIDERSLVAAGGYAPYTEVWLALPRVVACVPVGATVATTEVGFLGFARLDLEVLDLRGLTDRSIAKGEPAWVKHPWGVEAPDWASPSSAVGEAILRSEPDLIAEFDTPGSGSILHGDYRYAGTVAVVYGQVGPSALLKPLAIYERSGSRARC